MLWFKLRAIYSATNDAMIGIDMNERIKQLMGEAVKFRLDPDSNSYEAQVSPEDLEVFAELIVQECCDIFVELRTRPADLAVLDVKKHFGVN
jgi:hypothetical protein